MKGASKDAPKDGSGQGRDNGGQAGGTAQSQAKGGGPDSKVPEQSPQSKSGPGMGALDQSDRKTPQPTPEQVDRLTKLLDGKDGMAQLAARELRDIADRSPDPKVRDQAKQALDKKWNDILNQMAKEKRPGPGADNNPKSSQGDDGNADPARKDLSRFGGNLQLEDFLKRATPEYRAKAGITDDDWQLFLAKAADYDALLRKLQKQQAKAKAPDGRAKPGALGTSGPIQVQSTPSADDPFNSGQATVPPDLIDAQRRLREKLRPNP
jgi:hypothetical protein